MNVGGSESILNYPLFPLMSLYKAYQVNKQQVYLPLIVQPILKHLYEQAGLKIIIANCNNIWFKPVK